MVRATGYADVQRMRPPRAPIEGSDTTMDISRNVCKRSGISQHVRRPVLYAQEQ